jgi:predicted aspartyl protease
MIVAVLINRAGPYNFLLDTGAQMTMLDPTIAATLQLNTSGTAEMASAGASASASYAQAELI